MKAFQINSIQISGALINLFYEGYQNSDDCICLAELADEFSEISKDDKRQFKFAMNEYNECVSPETKTIIDNMLSHINISIDSEDVSIKDYKFKITYLLKDYNKSELNFNPVVCLV